MNKNRLFTFANNFDIHPGHATKQIDTALGCDRTSSLTDPLESSMLRSPSCWQRQDLLSCLLDSDHRTIIMYHGHETHEGQKLLLGDFDV